MYRNVGLKFSLAAALLCSSALITAQAEVIGAMPDADYSTSPVTVNFGSSGEASYTFGQFLLNPDSGTAGGVAGGLSTAGTALASQAPYNRDLVDAFGPGVTLSDSQTVGGPYSAFLNQSRTLADSKLDPATGLPDSFLALKFTLADGVHLGYALTTDSTLTSYAYESDAGAEIETGASITGTPPSQHPTPVPTPPSWAMFGLGLVLLGVARAIHRLRR